MPALILAALARAADAPCAGREVDLGQALVSAACDATGPADALDPDVEVTLVAPRRVRPGERALLEVVLRNRARAPRVVRFAVPALEGPGFRVETLGADGTSLDLPHTALARLVPPVLREVTLEGRGRATAVVPWMATRWEPAPGALLISSGGPVPLPPGSYEVVVHLPIAGTTARARVRVRP